MVKNAIYSDMRDAFQKVLKSYNFDYEKTIVWFHMKNGALEDLAPADLIMKDENKRVIEHIEERF